MIDCLLTHANVLLPDQIAANSSVAVQSGQISAIGDAAKRLDHLPCINLDGDWLLPGFIDLQVNGGGGVLFNDAPCAQTLQRMLEAHRPFGTTRLLPTLISADRRHMQAARDAVRQAQADGAQGVLGLHLEGPFLSPERRGVHDARYFRALRDEDLDWLAAADCGCLMLTLAPECQSVERIAQLAAMGVIVMLGHSAADTETTLATLHCMRAHAGLPICSMRCRLGWVARRACLGAALLDDGSLCRTDCRWPPLCILQALTLALALQTARTLLSGDRRDVHGR
jgi:N-acetylglucosamine-6-phosphate deacetylase